MHAKAMAVIKECFEQNKPGAPGYPHLTGSIRARLSATVGEVYWNEAHGWGGLCIEKEAEKKLD